MSVAVTLMLPREAKAEESFGVTWLQGYCCIATLLVAVFVTAVMGFGYSFLMHSHLGPAQ
jgi:hypothetical protein